MPPGQTVCPAFRRWERAEDLFRTRQYAVGAFAVYPAGDSGRFPANINDKKKRVTDISVTLACGLVPRAGLEPAQLLPLPPQDSVSTSSTTSAAKRTINVFSCSRQVFFSLRLRPGMRARIPPGDLRTKDGLHITVFYLPR